MAADVFVTRTLPDPEIAPLLDAGLEVDYRVEDSGCPADELHRRAAGVRALVTVLSDRIDAAAMDAAGPDLRVVANCAVGFDNIDLGAAAERGVVVTNTPDVLTEATADLAWALLMAAARRVVEGDRLVRSGEWGSPSLILLLGAPVHGKTLGVIGLGKIGTAVARRGRGFSMPILYTNRSRNPEAEAELGAERVELDELLERSDFVSVNAPLNDESHHLIDAAALARMKPTAILVNAGRGPIIDEAALVDALREGGIAGAGLDVFEREPTLADGLAELDNVVLMPHVGSATTETRGAMVRLCADNIVAVLAGREPLTPVR
jgi:glyoxylate reductase